MVEHGLDGDLDRAAAEQEVRERLVEAGDTPDPGQRAIRECPRQQGHHGQRLEEDRGPARPPDET
jgi:hypothetical protein